MARVLSLGSGSSGNSFFVGDAAGGVLIDVGLSFSKIFKALAQQGIGQRQVEALLLTHEHSDHVKGLGTFLKKTDIPVYATEGCAQRLFRSLPELEPRLRPVEKKKTFSVGHTAFSAFSVYHDAADAVGYRVETADRRQVVYCTDVGHVDEALLQDLSEADFHILEANYDVGMLQCNVAYPFLLRQRISGEKGHLSNADCAETVLQLLDTGSRRFLLAHLSEQNNTPQIAYETVRCALGNAGYVENSDYELCVAPRDDVRMLIF